VGATGGRLRRPSLSTRMRRGAHRFLVWLGALAAALILIAGAGLWRLMQGPIDLDLLTPYIQEALNRSVGGLRISRKRSTGLSEGYG